MPDPSIPSSERERPPPDRATGPDIARVLEDIAGQMDRLREYHAYREMREAELAVREARLAEQEELHRGRVEEFEHKARAVEGEIAALHLRRQDLERADQDRSAKEAALESRLREVESARADLSALEARIRERAEARTAELDARAASLAAQEREVAQREAALRHQAENSKQSDGARAVAERRAQDAERLLADTQAQFAAGEKEIATLRQSLAQAEHAADARQSAASREDIERLEAALAEASARVQRSETALKESEAARHRLAADLQAAARKTGRRDATLSLRLDRLRLMRELMRERIAKVAQAARLVDERYQVCEQILAKRNELLAANQAITRARRRVQSHRAWLTAAAAAFAAVATLTLAAILSWQAADRIVPGRYVARAVIGVDPRGRTLNDAELREWQAFHEGLLRDPQMIEFASERFARRGIVDLSQPGALTSRTIADMSHDSTGAGQLAIEWRGMGAARTERELDTFVTAVASRANAARGRRLDGAATKVVQPAKVADRPLDDDRPAFAAGILAVVLLLTLPAGVVAWRRMVVHKKRFDRGVVAASMLDDAQWDLDPAHTRTAA